MLNQLSVLVENKFGRLSAILKTLADNNIDISALSLADSSEFGVLRLIVDDTERSVSVLREAGVMVKRTPVIAAGMLNCPGGLSKITELLAGENISIEYMYAFIGKRDGFAWTVFKVNDAERAVRALSAEGIQMLDDASHVR